MNIYQVTTYGSCWSIAYERVYEIWMTVTFSEFNLFMFTFKDLLSIVIKDVNFVWIGLKSCIVLDVYEIQEWTTLLTLTLLGHDRYKS